MVKTAVKKVTTPGTTSSEFWLSLVLIVCATVLRFTDTISDEMWGIVAGAQGVGYSVSRGLAKKN